VTLRWYQQKAIDEIRAHFAAGTKKCLLHAATGSGKTVVFSEVLKSAHGKGKSAIMVVRGKDLVDQASKRLMRENVPHGCIQGSHWNNQPNARIQICSIDTLYRRGMLPAADLVVIDEAHYATSASFKWLVKSYPDAFFLPVSATPHVKGGLRHIADAVVYPITMGQLMLEGFLAVPICYAPTHINLDGVGLDSRTGDYNPVELSAAVEKSPVYGDVPKHYKQICDGQPAVLFAVNVKHSKTFVERFEAAGIPAVHVDAETPKAERDQAIADLESGKIKVICNVGILTTGVDIPFLKVVILARPTKSYNLYVQCVGRGTRIVPGKKSFIVLDHANNIETHGFVEAERQCHLDGKKGKTAVESYTKPSMCHHCYMLFGYDKNRTKCPSCGEDMRGMVTNLTPRNRDALEQDGALTVLQYDIKVLESLTKELPGLIRIAILKNFKAGWVYHNVKTKYGSRYANSVWHHIKTAIDRGNEAAQQTAG
jgi:superfamily II DNA or RNA helicase